jgi:hypothetical protein
MASAIPRVLPVNVPVPVPVPENGNTDPSEC